MDRYSTRKIIETSLESRTSYIEKGRLEVFRLYNHDQKGWHDLAIDIYKDNAVLHLFEPVSKNVCKDIEETLRQFNLAHQYFYKRRFAGPQQSQAATRQHVNITITEYGHKFLVNLSDYVDTGLFLDHRETRKWLGRQAKGKIVLNTFAYTGAFTVYAAKAGAEKTYSVDISKTYCDWLKQNLALNDLPLDDNWVYKMDTFEFFKYSRRKELRFDIIIIDPPTFSRDKHKSFSVQKDHPRLINEALELLRPEGFVLFSSGYKSFKMKRPQLSPCVIRELHAIPPDFRGERPHQCYMLKPHTPVR